jgi:hypothetical protein
LRNKKFYIKKEIQAQMQAKIYFSVTALYGVGRTSYWLSKINDRTYTNSGYKSHPPTLMTSLMMYTVSACTSPVLWWIYLFSDIDSYEKAKFNIQEICPPYPFNSFEWKDKK